MTNFLQAPAILTQKTVKGAEMFFTKAFPKDGCDAFLLIRSHETAQKSCEILKARLGENRTVSIQQILDQIAETLMPASRATSALLKRMFLSVDLFHACRSFRGGVGFSNTFATTTSDSTGFLFTQRSSAVSQAKSGQQCLKTAKL